MPNESHATELRYMEASASKITGYGFPKTTTSNWARRITFEPLSPWESYEYRVIKRVVDLLVIVFSLPVLLPALLIVVAVVRFTSPGPIFFSHRRICRNGAFFSMWKFRTMCRNSAEVLEQHLAKHPKARVEWNKTHKLRVDPRITPIGHFLRRYSLDELPQAWNVMMGQMSLVGPRPIVAAEVEKYGIFFEFYSCVKPGISGLWQVSGRSRLSYDARIRMDREYVQHWSLWNDLRILLLTCRSVVNREGAC